GDEPGEVVGGRLHGLRGDLVAGAGEVAVEQRHADDQPLLEQRRPRQQQDQAPRRQRHVGERRGGRGGGGRLQGERGGGRRVGQAMSVHWPPPATPKRSPARSLRPGCVTAAPLTVKLPSRTRTFAWPPVSASPTALTAWASVM